MNYEKIDSIAFLHMGNKRPDSNRETGFIYYHGKRTARLAVELKKRLGFEKKGEKILYTGALFHDVGKGSEKHHEIGAELIKTILKDHFKDEGLKEIAKIVLNHNQRNSHKDFNESILIVQDADLLDHVGTLEIWLKFLNNANNNETVHKALDYWKSNEYRDYLKWALNALNYEISRKIFKDRLAFSDEFIRRFEKEIEGELF